jgi:hypothetical protein
MSLNAEGFCAALGYERIARIEVAIVSNCVPVKAHHDGVPPPSYTRASPFKALGSSRATPPTLTWHIWAK